MTELLVPKSPKLWEQFGGMWLWIGTSTFNIFFSQYGWHIVCFQLMTGSFVYLIDQTALKHPTYTMWPSIIKWGTMRRVSKFGFIIIHCNEKKNFYTFSCNLLSMIFLSKITTCWTLIKDDEYLGTKMNFTTKYLILGHTCWQCFRNLLDPCYTPVCTYMYIIIEVSEFVRKMGTCIWMIW